MKKILVSDVVLAELKRLLPESVKESMYLGHAMNCVLVDEPIVRLAAHGSLSSAERALRVALLATGRKRVSPILGDVRRVVEK